MTYDPNKPTLRLRTRPADQRLFGGDLIEGTDATGSWICTLGFGGSEQRGKKPNGQPEFLHFAITAGHCWEKGTEVKRVATKEGKEYSIPIGTVKRRVYMPEPPNQIIQDGEAILLNGICASGAVYAGGANCGIATEPFVAYPEDSPHYWVVETVAVTTHGDSGGPIWDVRTGNAVGLVEGGFGYTGPTWFTPLEPVPLPNGTTAPGLLAELDAPDGGPFNVAR